MEKPETFIAGIALGGLLLGAGYAAGRASVSGAPLIKTGANQQPANPRLAPTARRPRPKPARPDAKVIVGVTASSVQPPAGVTIEAGDALDVHADPDPASPVVGTIAREVRVHVLRDQADGWSVVSRPDDAGFAFGWVQWARPAAAPRGPRGALGTATIRGVVRFTGRPPVMAVPKKRKDAEFCKDKAVPYNAVVVNGGKLADVIVHILDEAVQGSYEPPQAHAVIDQIDCMYAPRIQGVVAGQVLDIRNSDGTLHDVHTYRGVESWFNRPQIKGSAPTRQEMPDTPGIVRFACDVHPWMRAFVVVSAHPFFAVSGADGAFTIDHVPAGRYPMEAWHPRYGRKLAKVEVTEGGAAEVSFSYDGAEPEPPEDRDEMKDLF